MKSSSKMKKKNKKHTIHYPNNNFIVDTVQIIILIIIKNNNLKEIYKQLYRKIRIIIKINNQIIIKELLIVHQIHQK